MPRSSRTFRESASRRRSVFSTIARSTDPSRRPPTSCRSKASDGNPGPPLRKLLKLRCARTARIAKKCPGTRVSRTRQLAGRRHRQRPAPRLEGSLGPRTNEAYNFVSFFGGSKRASSDHSLAGETSPEESCGRPLPQHTRSYLSRSARFRRDRKTTLTTTRRHSPPALWQEVRDRRSMTSPG